MYKDQTDGAAFLFLQEGNDEGLQIFFNRHYSSLAYYATSYTKQSEVAKEIAADAFVKLWAKRESIENWRQVKPLLYKMVHDASVDYVREVERLKKKTTQLKAILPITEPSPLDKLIETETYYRLHVLLQTLAPRSRQIFQMFYLQKKAVKEIAAELGISVNTVKTQKLRALQTLKQYGRSFYLLILLLHFF